MLELKKGDEILAVVGGITTIAEARNVFADNLDEVNNKKLAQIQNEEALIKIANAITMCRPDSVFVNTGSAADVQWIREYSLNQSEEKKLAKAGHTIHFDLPEDQPVRQRFPFLL